MTRMYDGELEADATAATIPLSPRGARPPRRNAMGELLTDGPYEHVNGAGVKRLSVSVSAADAEGTVTLQGCNGDPANGPWADLASVTAQAGDSEVLMAEDLSSLYLRLQGAGTGATLTVELVTNC